MLIKDIEPNAQSGNLSPDLFYYASTANTIVKNRETLKLMVDKPCLEACEYLFDCNILTTTSSANKNDISAGSGFIGVNYDSLDETNKEIYNKLKERQLVKEFGSHKDAYGINKHDFLIEIPITSETTSEEFSKKLMEIVKVFQKQELIYGSYSKEEFKNIAYNGLSNFVMTDDFVGTFEKYLLSKYKNDIYVDNILKEYASINEFYYDEQEERYWISKELYLKAKRIKENNK